MTQHSEEFGRRKFLITGVVALGVGIVAFLEIPKNILNPSTTTSTVTVTSTSPTTITSPTTVTSKTTVTTTIPTTTTITSTTSQSFQDAVNAFNSILNRTKIKIYSATGQILRDIRDSDFSNGLQYGVSNPYVSCFVRCDDCESVNEIDMKADILFAMYYKPNNDDSLINGWGKVPVVFCEAFYAGAYTKDVLVDGSQIWSYSASNGNSYCKMHFNMITNDVKVFA